MDRRKTLGGLSPGQLNSRASLAPGRVVNKDGKSGWGGGAAGLGKPLDKALSRLSLAGPVQRRSSAYTTKAPGVKSDPRPVGDKLYQQNCVRTVITFLASHGYEYQVTPKVRRGVGGRGGPTAAAQGRRCRAARSAEGAGAPAPAEGRAQRRSPAAPISHIFVASSGAVEPDDQGLHQPHDLPGPPD